MNSTSQDQCTLRENVRVLQLTLPAIQIPVLMFFNKHDPQASNIFSMVFSLTIFTGKLNLSVKRASCEWKRNAPIRIQSDFPTAKIKTKTIKKVIRQYEPLQIYFCLLNLLRIRQYLAEEDLLDCLGRSKAIKKCLLSNCKHKQ